MMVSGKRVWIVASLIAYLLATSFVHALHDHSAAGHCCDETQAVSWQATRAECDAKESAHRGVPTHADDHESSCFACRFLAAKAIVPVAVVVVERIEVLHQVEPQQHLFAPAIRPELPFSRGPPCA
jgi:hypothetical protein